MFAIWNTQRDMEKSRQGCADPLRGTLLEAPQERREQLPEPLRGNR